MKKINFLLCLVLLVNNHLNYCFRIDRAILSSDANPMYLQFWPLVAQAWKQLIGIEPTLALIAEDDVAVDTTVGDVIRIKPIPGISTASHAQIIRLLLPIYFENDICILSDIDMLPISKDYFVNSVAPIADDVFVVYRNKATDGRRIPMCYNAGKGYLFKSLFNIQSIDDIPSKIKEWVSLGYGWDTDELVLTKAVYSWELFKTNCVLLSHTTEFHRRIDRSRWGYNRNKLLQNYYIDAHMVRPLDKYYKEIKQLVDDLGLQI